MGVFSKWVPQKWLKMAHLAIFRHKGGVGESRKKKTLKFSGSRWSVQKMAALRALWAEKLIFSLKTLQCWIDLAPKHMPVSPFKTQFDHFHFYPFVQLIWRVDLKIYHIDNSHVWFWYSTIFNKIWLKVGLVPKNFNGHNK